jgi:hypothetical protein
MLNVLIAFNRTAVNLCKILLVATIGGRKLYLFVYADVSNKWNFVV